MRYAIVFFTLIISAHADIISDVRAAVAQGNFAQGDAAIERYRKSSGVTPELLEASSWMARGALKAKQLDKAEAYAGKTEELTKGLLKQRAVDSDPHIAIALGAAIEVQAQVLAERGQRADAVALLKKDLAAYDRTSIHARIQKNINVLSLEGKVAPQLDEREYLGVKPVSLNSLKGKPVILFFWAHWCGDCKAEGPLLNQLAREYASKGLTVVAPTQRYGYAARGEDATPAQELKYIDQVRHQFYPDLLQDATPLSEQNFKLYGASTTPTLVFIDRKGTVRVYHPGAMTMDELQSAAHAIL